MKKHLEINHADERGTIRDIFVCNPKDHCTIITFTVNSVRGNHFHKKSTQFTYLINGELLMATCLLDQQGESVGEVEQVVLFPGDLVTHQPYQAHAFRAVTPCTILAFSDGIRGGNDYEKDVFRLKIPIL